MSEIKDKTKKMEVSRRDFIKTGALVTTAAVVGGCGISKEEFLQQHFKELTQEDVKNIKKRLETEYEKEFGKKFSVSFKEPIPQTLFGYGLDISRCIGCRRCVYACVDENNLSIDPQIHWIQVLEMEKSKGVNFHHANLHYDREKVPDDDHFYLPVACQQCENPPCVKACPVEATWKEKDGIVVVDYNWCIGCRNCMAACPYGARHFNWKKPSYIDPKTKKKSELNEDTHYLGNRPRPQGIVDKCTFCVQRTREGKYPACVEICPVGARKFGNLLDPDSEISYILKNKRVLILKEELNTQPKFFYFYAT